MNTSSQCNSNRDTMQQILELLQLQLTKEIGSSSSSHADLLKGLYNIMQSANHPWLVVAGEEWKPYQKSKSGSEVEFRSTTTRLVVREQQDKLVMDGQLIESDSETHRCGEYDMPTTVYDLLQLMEQHIRLINHQKSGMAQKQKPDMSRDLFEAAGSGNLDVVRFLVPLRLVRTPDKVRAQRTNLGQSENGADIHVADSDAPDAALRWAAKNGHLDVVRFLCENGADIHVANKEGPDYAVRGAAHNGHLNVVRFLVEKGANIHAINDYAVRGAAQEGHLDVVRFLFEKGADIRAVGRDGPNFAVRWAARFGHLDVVRFLVENGADIHADDDWALREAARFGHLDVVRFLVEKGADIHVVNDYALKYAKQNGHLEVARFLLKKEYDQKLRSLLSQTQKG